MRVEVEGLFRPNIQFRIYKNISLYCIFRGFPISSPITQERVELRADEAHRTAQKFQKLC